MSHSSEVYLGLDKPCLGSVESDPILQWWELHHLQFAEVYWERNKEQNPNFARWANLAREELAIRKVTKVLLR